MASLNAEKQKLAYRYIDCGRTFRTLLNVKGHAVTFAQAFKTGCIDGRMMDKHIRSTLLLDENRNPFGR